MAAPKYAAPKPRRESAPAHMIHGSIVTYSSHLQRAAGWWPGRGPHSRWARQRRHKGGWEGGGRPPTTGHKPGRRSSVWQGVPFKVDRIHITTILSKQLVNRLQLRMASGLQQDMRFGSQTGSSTRGGSALCAAQQQPVHMHTCRSCWSLYSAGLCAAGAHYECGWSGCAQ